MTTAFYDKNGEALNVGDFCEAIVGNRVKIIAIEYYGEYNDNVLIGQIVKEPSSYCILTSDDLSTNFQKVMP